MYRGGNWNNGANAGLFYLNGNNPRSNSNANIGFRPALASRVMLCGLRLGRNNEAKGAYFPAEKAKEERSRSSPVEATGSDEQNRAGWPILCKQVKGGRDPPAWQLERNGRSKDCHTRAIF